MPPVLFNVFRCLLFAVVISVAIGGWVGAAIGAAAGLAVFCWLSLVERNQRKKRLKDAEQNQRRVRSEKVLGRRRERQEKRQAIRNAGRACGRSGGEISIQIPNVRLACGRGAKQSCCCRRVNQTRRRCECPKPCRLDSLALCKISRGNGRLRRACEQWRG